jgi:exodeoxyribonuclease VII large subunit
MTNQPIKLSEFATHIRNVIDNGFAGQLFWVIAEISNFTPRKGIQYFHLVEKDEASGSLLAEISAISFQQGVSEMEAFERETGQKFSNGIKVMAQVSVAFHEIYGLKVHLIRLDPSFTKGELQKQREATLNRLVVENPDSVQFIEGKYYSRNQTIELPLVISNVAVISSETSAGLEDFRHTLQSNPFNYHFNIELFHTKVQGDEDGKKSVERLIEVFHRKDEFDIVVIVRGGGAQTDFLMYDSYNLARAIARFPIPVFTGLGHLKDISICDLMAHTSEKTPTKVAEKIIAHNRAFEDSITNLRQLIIIRAQQIVATHKELLSDKNLLIRHQTNQLLQEHAQSLNQIRQVVANRSVAAVYKNRNALHDIGRRLSTKPLIRINQAKHQLDSHIEVLELASARLIKNNKGYIKHYQSLFHLLSPARTLARGFAIIKQNDKIISNSKALKSGDEIQVYLSGTDITATINQKQKSDDKQFDL